MRRVLVWAFALLLLPVLPATALSADLNKDGVVDFDDFFAFGDQFGRQGDPDVSDTVVVIRLDTAQVTLHDTLLLRDTLVVIVNSIDTLYVDPADTVTRSGTPISFADPALEFAIRTRVGVDTGELLTGDVTNITSLNLTGLSISLLSGLQHFTSLTTLSLTSNLVVDVSPLQGLTALKSVSLANNQVRDIAPLVSNAALASGSSVILAGNPLSVTSRTTHVRALQDRGATVTADAFVVTFADSLLEVAVRSALQQSTGDLKHLDLETITTLDVASDGISNLSGMEFMRGLVDLDLRDNQITSIAQLSSLKKLQVLDLSDNTVGSFSPLAGLTALRDLRLTGTGMTSVSPLTNLTSMQILYLNLNAIDSITSLGNLTDMRQINLRDNRIVELTALLGMTALTDVWVESNNLNSDASSTVIPALIDQGAFVRF
ncbi:MAG: leucine-rich repeat domain-containing protein [bacterium]|nr:leucine-rich repeat domain-containing protein [bacterium]